MLLLIHDQDVTCSLVSPDNQFHVDGLFWFADFAVYIIVGRNLS